jgi:hypothetical protein
MLLENQQFLFPSFGNRVARITSWSPTGLHVFGWLAIAVAVALTILYFYARHAIARDEQAPPPHFLDS